MTYTVPDRGGNPTYIVRNETGYPEKLETMIAEYAKLLDDVNGGINSIPNITTGNAYFQKLSDSIGSVHSTVYSGSSLTITDTNISTYNNKLIIMTSTANTTINIAISSSGILDPAFRFEVLLYGTATWIDFTSNSSIVSVGGATRLSGQYSHATVTYLPGVGSMTYLLTSNNLS